MALSPELEMIHSKISSGSLFNDLLEDPEPSETGTTLTAANAKIIVEAIEESKLKRNSSFVKMYKTYGLCLLPPPPIKKYNFEIYNLLYSKMLKVDLQKSELIRQNLWVMVFLERTIPDFFRKSRSEMRDLVDQKFEEWKSKAEGNLNYYILQIMSDLDQ